MLLLDALGPARGAARPRAQIVPVAEVGRIASFLLQLELLLVVPELVPSVAQQTGEIRYPLPLGSDLSHEAANLLEIRLVRPRQLAVIPRSHLVEYRRPICVVLLQVSVQIGLLPETPFAQGAFERFLLVVNIPHVALQVARDAEAPLAVLALVRLLAGVGAQVSGQVCGSGEHLAAKLARVPILHLAVGVVVVVVVVRRDHRLLKRFHAGERPQRRPGEQVESSASRPSAAEPVHERP